MAGFRQRFAIAESGAMSWRDGRIAAVCAREVSRGVGADLAGTLLFGAGARGLLASPMHTSGRFLSSAAVPHRPAQQLVQFDSSHGASWTALTSTARTTPLLEFLPTH